MIEYRTGQLLRFGRAPNTKGHEVAEVVQVETNEHDGATVALWVASPYQHQEPVRVLVAELVCVEELAELPAVKAKKKRPAPDVAEAIAPEPTPEPEEEPAADEERYHAGRHREE